MKLTRPELEQLEYYCRLADEDGTYYGNRSYFIIRHRNILSFLQQEKYNLIVKDVNKTVDKEAK